MRVISIVPTRSKTTLTGFRYLFFVLCALGVLCGEATAQNFKTVHDGIEFAQLDHKLGTDPVKINLLRLDLTKVRVDVHHALDKAIGLETTSAIAERKGAVAAINAGFFRLDKTQFAGDPVGVFVIDGLPISESSARRIALIIQNDADRSAAIIHHLESRAEIRLGGPNYVNPMSISGMNRERKEGEVILYGPEFGAATISDTSGNEMVVAGCNKSRDVRSYWFRECEQIQLRPRSSANPIPRDGYVISFSSSATEKWAAIEKEIREVSSKKSPKISIEYSIGFDGNTLLFPQKTTDIVTGVPRLVTSSRIDITWEIEKASRSFAETRHPRTAVAKLKDGKFLMITVDGRQPGVSVGMSLQELAEYLLSLGAVDAMNLDGGGSTTMFLDGKVVNTPSDKEGERKVGDAILVSLRKKGPAAKKK